MNKTSIRPSVNFYIISSLALVWNLIGVFAYLGQTFMEEQALSSLSKDEQYYFSNMPAWVTAVFASAVFAGVFGSVCMLLKKRIAKILYSISIVSLLAHQVYNLFIQDYIVISGVGLLLPISTTVIGFFLLWYSHQVSKQGVLN
jgi:hypothetical protein